MLTTEDHRRDSAGLTYVYPVVSRRAGGISIGINLNINNACNWACIYCQVENLTRGGPPPVNLALLQCELDSLLTDIHKGDFMQRAVPPEARKLADIAFSGNGEPTCAAEFADAVTIARDALSARNLLPHVCLRLITNGSQLHRPGVQRGLALLGECGGEVWFKLDRADRESTLRINGIALSPDRVLAQVRQSCRLATTWLQTCWFGQNGCPPGKQERQAYCAMAQEVAGDIAGIHLYGLARPSMQQCASHLYRLPADELADFAREIEKETGVRVNINP